MREVMDGTAWTEQDSARAQEIWSAYQRQHDVSDQVGQTAGIDPLSGRIWFGESARDVVEKMHAEGIDTVLFCIRVGFDYYVRKGRRACSPAR
jgi:hypothetical protein